MTGNTLTLLMALLLDNGAAGKAVKIPVEGLSRSVCNQSNSQAFWLPDDQGLRIEFREVSASSSKGLTRKKLNCELNLLIPVPRGKRLRLIESQLNFDFQRPDLGQGFLSMRFRPSGQSSEATSVALPEGQGNASLELPGGALSPCSEGEVPFSLNVFGVVRTENLRRSNELGQNTSISLNELQGNFKLVNCNDSY